MLHWEWEEPGLTPTLRVISWVVWEAINISKPVLLTPWVFLIVCISCHLYQNQWLCLFKVRIPGPLPEWPSRTLWVWGPRATSLTGSQVVLKCTEIWASSSSMIPFQHVTAPCVFMHIRLWWLWTQRIIVNILEQHRAEYVLHYSFMNTYSPTTFYVSGTILGLHQSKEIKILACPHGPYILVCGSRNNKWTISKYKNRWII